MNSWIRGGVLIVVFAMAMQMAPFACADVSSPVSKVEMSREWRYGRPGESLTYRCDIAVEADASVTGVVCRRSDGDCLPLVLDPDDGWWSYGAEYAAPSGLDAFECGEYLFTVAYAAGPQDTTGVAYETPGGGPIPQVT